MNDSATKTILEKIKNSGLLAGIEEKEAASLLAKRKEAAQQIAVLERERADSLPKMQDALKEKEAELKKVQVICQGLEAEVRQAQLAIWSKNFTYDQQIGQMKDILLEGYDPKIDEALEWFDKKLSWLRADGRVRYHFEDKKSNLIDWTETKKISTNRFAVLDALEYCKRSIQILNQMKLLPQVGEKAIESLKAGLADVDDYKCFVSIERIKDIDPQQSARTQFLIDCLVADYNSERVNEKYERLMKIKRYYPWPSAS